MSPDLPSMQIAATVALNLSMALATGAGMSLGWLHGRVSPWAGGEAGRLHPLLIASAIVALLAHAAVLWLEAASMAELPPLSSAPAIQTVLTATHYGLAWTIGACALAVLIMGSAMRRGRVPGRAATLACLLSIGVFLYSRSMVSHAGASGDFTLSILVDWLHLVLISLWVGEVLVSGLVTLRTPPKASLQDGGDVAGYVQALSRSATVALFGIFATGAFNAWRGLGSFANAIGNEYATVLLIKLAFVTGAATLGGVNRFFVMPRLLADLRNAAPPAQALQRRFALVLQIEAILLCAAVVMAAILSSTPPPAAG